MLCTMDRGLGVTEDNLEYFAQRLAEEELAAHRARNERVAAAHRELAQSYRRVVEAYEPLMKRRASQ